MASNHVRLFLFSFVLLIAVTAVAQTTSDSVVKENNPVTIDWHTPRGALEKEAEKDNPDALFYIALHSLFGSNGFTKDEARRSEFLQKGAEFADQGSPAAQCCRGLCYLKGYGVELDEGEAVQWFRKSAEQGFAIAQHHLGDCYYDGSGVDQNLDEAVKWWRKAAEQGHAESQYNLGVCYEHGTSVPQNWAEAARWYRRAAEQGFASGQYNLGVCYEHGTGVPQNWAEAVKWYRKAAEQGFALGQNNLGACYHNGTGVTKDVKEAVKWYLKAAEQGEVTAQFNLGNIYEDRTLGHRNYAESRKWFQKAAEQGHAESQRKLDFTPPSPAGIFLPLTAFVLIVMGFIYWLLYQRPPIVDGVQPVHTNTMTSEDVAFYRNMAMARSWAINSLYIALTFMALCVFGNAFFLKREIQMPSMWFWGLFYYRQYFASGFTFFVLRD